MHSCKVHSRSAVQVSAAEYDAQYKRVSSGLFSSALSKAQKQIMQKEHAWEKQLYQDEFTLPLSRNMFGLFTIPVYINHIRAVFVVDTGAQISGIKSERLAHFQMRKAPGSLQIGSIGGKMRDMQGLVADSMQMGALEIRNMAMIALDSSDFTLRFGNIDLFGFDGILGWDILHQLDFEMDDIAKQFLVVKNRFRLPYPNMIKGGFPCILAKRPDGGISLFGFDSGSRVSWIGESAVREHALQIVHEGSAMGFGVHGLEKMDLKIVKEWTLFVDKAEITLKDTMTGRVDLFDHFTFDGVFGNEIFKRRRIRIINSAGMVLLA